MFSQNPSPLTFDQIYRSGTSSVSPVSQYRSQFEDRGLNRFSIPGRLSEPLGREFGPSPFALKSSLNEKCAKLGDVNNVKKKPSPKIWNPFGDESKSFDQEGKPKSSSSFSIDALTKGCNKETNIETVDANGNVTGKESEKEKTNPEKPRSVYPIRPIPVFSSGITSFNTSSRWNDNPFNYCNKRPVTEISAECEHSDSNTACFSPAISTSETYVTVSKPADNGNVISDCVSVNELKSIDSSEGCAITNSEKQGDTSEDLKTSGSESDLPVPTTSVNSEHKKHVLKELQISLPVLKIEIPQCSIKKGEVVTDIKSPDLSSPKSRITSPSKGKQSKKDELSILSQQVNEVRNRRSSKELLSPVLLSPKSKKDNSVSFASENQPIISPSLLSPKRDKRSTSLSSKSNANVLSPLNKENKQNRVKTANLTKRRSSLPSHVLSGAQFKLRARMTSTAGAITMMKGAEDSMSASISSSHLSDSDSDTQMSNDTSTKPYSESQTPMNTQAGFQGAPNHHGLPGNQGFMPAFAAEGMNTDNHYYKMNPQQVCQNETDNQKPFPCVPNVGYNDKPDILPSYNCYAANQSPGSVLPREPSFHSQEENSNFPSNLAGADSSIDYHDENSVMSDPGHMHGRCDSQSSGSNLGPPDSMMDKEFTKTNSNQGSATPVPAEYGMQDEGQWDFLHSKQYIENIYGGQGCEIVKSESNEIRESDSPKTFIDLDKTTKEKKAQESSKGNSKDGYGGKGFGKAQYMRQGYPPGQRGGGVYSTQSYDNYHHMVGSRWGNFNRNDNGMGNQPNQPGDNFGRPQYDQQHQYRNNYPPNYQGMNPNQNGNEKPQFQQGGYHGNEFNQSDPYYGQNAPAKNFQGNPPNYGNGRYDNGFYQNRGGNEYSSQNTMYPPPSSSEQPGSRFSSQAYSGTQGNYSQHYNQQSPHHPPDSISQYHQDMPSYPNPRNASPASTGSDFGTMEAPGVIPKKKRGRKRKIDKEPPDENKPRPNTIVMAPTKLGPLIDIDNPECTIDTYDYNNQIETIFNFNIEDDLSPIGAQFLQIEQRICQKMLPIKYGYPVTVIYSPLTYAFQTHRDFVAKFCTSERTLLFLGMNPGPYGMSQNGVRYLQIKLFSYNFTWQ